MHAENENRKPLTRMGGKVLPNPICPNLQPHGLCALNYLQNPVHPWITRSNGANGTHYGECHPPSPEGIPPCRSEPMIFKPGREHCVQISICGGIVGWEREELIKNLVLATSSESQIRTPSSNEAPWASKGWSHSAVWCARTRLPSASWLQRFQEASTSLLIHAARERSRTPEGTKLSF